MKIPGWVMLGAVGVVVLVGLEMTKPDNTPPPPTTTDAFFDAAGGGVLSTLHIMLEHGLAVNV